MVGAKERLPSLYVFAREYRMTSSTLHLMSKRKSGYFMSFSN